MRIKPRHAVWMLSLLLALALATAAAQELAPPLLTLTSPDLAHPVQFQLIAPGDTPTRAGFVSALPIAGPEVDPALSRVYITIENTGWSAGVIGLISEALDPDGQYVALEVDADGQPVAGGLAFDLVYDAEQGATGGFTLSVLLSRAARFGIFPAGVVDGEPFPAVTNVREIDGTVSAIAVGISLAAPPVARFAPLVLDFHIIAAPTPTATPPAVNAPVAAEGWGACGSCASCGHPGECVRAPDGGCAWNPGGCGAGPLPGPLPGSDLLTPVHLSMITMTASPLPATPMPSDTPWPTLTP